MKSNNTLLLAALMCNLGCEPEPKPGDGDDTGDTAPAEPMSLATVDEVVAAESLTKMPYGLYMLVVWLPMALDPEGSCPSMERVSEHEYILTGGCTDENGDVWTGAVTYTETDSEGRETFEGWGIEGEFIADGALVMSDGGDVAPIVTEAFELGGSFEGPSGEVTDLTASYHAFTTALPLVDGSVNMYGELEVSGDVRVAELGEFTVSGLIGPSQVCTLESDSGGLAFVGDGQASVTYDGASDCDGCYTGTTSDGVDHELCPD